MARPPAAADTATIEVLGIEQAPDLGLLEGGHIDGPRRGQIGGPVLRMAGWIVGREAPAVAVEISCGERIVSAARIDIDRPDVGAIYPHSAGASRAGFRAQMDGSLLPLDFHLRLVALLEDGNRAVVGSVHARRGGSDGESLGQPAAGDTPSLKPELEKLLSRSIGQQAPDGDHDSLLDRLPLEGREVLDLGSGLGHLSRKARARGAELVDGFELDADRVRVARLLNAYHGATRVSFYDRDVTDPDSYSESYDIVLALSGATGLEDVMGKIAEITGTTFATELRGGGEDHAALLASIEKAFPSIEVVASESADRRYVIARTGPAEGEG